MLSTVNDTVELPSTFSSLPVALVVEQTARILEDIKKKIQLQREEEERLRNEQEKESSTTKIVRESSEERTFSASSTKSFVILNNNRSSFGDTTTHVKRIPKSLSPDSGTDYSLPFSASSSISPPFLSEKNKGNTNSTDYPSKFSDDEIFKSLTTYSSSYASSSVIYSTPKYTAVSPTSPLSSKRRFSGISIPFTTTTSLAKSTPSISTDLIIEGHRDESIIDAHHHHHQHQHVRPLSFQVLQSDFTFETYHHPTLLDAATKQRYKSLANLPTSSSASPGDREVVATSRPSIEISSTAIAAATTSNLNRTAAKLAGTLLNGNARQTFGDDPWHIRPISSALEYNSAFKMPSFPMMSIDTLNSMKVEKTASFEKSTKSFDESLIIPRIDHLSRKIEKLMRPENSSSSSQKQQRQQQQAQAADYLSLSLSPPLNRRNKNMSMLKGIGLSL